MFHILKAACVQVWDRLALEGKQHFGGHTLTQGCQRAEDEMSSVYSLTTFQENRRGEIQEGGHCWRRGDHDLLKSPVIFCTSSLLCRKQKCKCI